MIAKTRYVNDKQITDHYAIIPTGQGIGAIKTLHERAVHVYEVIVRRFLAIFYPPAIYRRVNLTAKVITSDMPEQFLAEMFFASFKLLADPGYLNVMNYSFRKKADAGKEKPEERVESLIWSISEEGIEWEEVQKRMGEPVCNISQSFMDGFVRANAEFRHKVGMRTEIVRKLQGGACKWCKNLAGSYNYTDTPKDVYRRHDNCRCTVTFKQERMRINVWSKEEWNI